MMNPRTRAFVSFAVLIVLLIGLYFFTQWFSLFTGYVLGEDEKTKLAQCLNAKGSVFYVSDTCPGCAEQLDLFGSASEFVSVNTCSSIEECDFLERVPAWRINGEFHYGLYELEDLIAISGCDVN